MDNTMLSSGNLTVLPTRLCGALIIWTVYHCAVDDEKTDRGPQRRFLQNAVLKHNAVLPALGL